MNQKNAYIHLLCVETHFRRKNWHQKLINEFIKIVSDMGSTKISSPLAKPSNNNAIKFYNKNRVLFQKKSDKTFEDRWYKYI